MRYCVPAVPAYDLYAEVSIGDAVIPDLAYELAIVINSEATDPFGLKEEMIPLGLWSPGEGRLIIASAVNDWAEGVADPKCISTKHGFEQEMQLQKMAKAPDATWVKADRWCMAYYKCCYPCYQTKQNTASGSTGIVDFTAGSFGVNPGDFGGGGRAPSAAQARARDALRQRYGNRASAVIAGQEPTDLGSNEWDGPEF
jgi:hypothetical protein